MSSNDGPDNSISFEDEGERLKATVAEALGVWSWIEYRMCHIVYRATAAGSFTASCAAFYSLVNFRTKLDVTTAVVNARNDIPELSDEWSKLVTKLSRANKERVPLAHPTFTSWPQAKAGDRWFVSKPMLDPTTWASEGGEGQSLTYNNVKDRARRFDALMHECQEFLERLPIPPSALVDIPQLSSDKDLPGSLKRQFRRGPERRD